MKSKTKVKAVPVRAGSIKAVLEQIMLHEGERSSESSSFNHVPQSLDDVISSFPIPAGIDKGLVYQRLQDYDDAIEAALKAFASLAIAFDAQGWVVDEFGEEG